MLKKLIPKMINRASRRVFEFNQYNKFSSRKIDPSTGIEIEEEKIKEKLKKMRERSESGILEDLKVKKKVPEFMKSYKIKALNPQIKEFRDTTRTNQIFSFEDYSLQTKPVPLQITGFGPQVIQINNTMYPPCLIITPFQVFIWQVRHAKDINLRHFDFARIIAPKPDHIVIGVQDMNDLSSSLKHELEKDFTIVNINEWFEAVSLFNTESNDQNNIMGFFIME